MTRTTFVSLSLAVLIGTSLNAQQPPDPLPPAAGEPFVQLGLAARDADGRVIGSASSTGETAGDSLTGLVYLSPCQSSGASSQLRPPAAATDAWQLGGHIVSFDAGQVVVAVTWKRVRRNGSDVDDAGQAGTFRLRLGERQTLETITIPPRGSCPERISSLDVAYTRKPVSVRRPGGGAWNSTVGPAVRRSGDGGGTAIGFSGRGGVRRPTVDLWLVQSAPGVADRIHHLRTEASVLVRAVTFPRTTIATATGTFTVDVECYVEDGLTPEGDARLFVSASRTVDFAPLAGQTRDRRPIAESSVKTAIERPGPDEVVEFELPPIEYPGAPAVPDRLAIRLRVVPDAD